MKRSAYISLVILILIIAIQPVVSVHYCHGDIESFDINTTQTKTCCDQMPEEGISVEDCCDEETLVLSTDNYQLPKVQSNIDYSSLFVFIHNNLHTSLLFDSELKQEQFIPFDTLFEKALNRLSYICVYKI